MGQKQKPCEEKKIFAPKIISENAFKKRGYHLQQPNLKVQDLTKRCELISLNEPNFLYNYEKHFFSLKKSKKNFEKEIEKLTCLLYFKHPTSDFLLMYIF